MNPGALWSEFARGIQYHRANPAHDEIDTVNRLLRKHPVLKDRGQVLQLPKGHLRVEEEHWTLEQLWGLIHPAHLTPLEPSSTEHAVTVVRWSGENFLMDGRRRINHWKRSANEGPHRVLVLQADG